MTRVRFWPAAATLLALAAGLVPSAPAWADVGPLLLPDSTIFESYTLLNGLRVATRNVPGCRHVDVTVAYDFGRIDEAAGQEGMSALLAELQFHGATAEAPERTRAEMRSLRPAGWDAVAAQRVTRFSEVAQPRLLAGMIHEAAVRMRGVAVTPALLKTAVAAVRADLDSAWRVSTGVALHNAARAWAEGDGDSRVARMAQARGLENVSVKDVQQRMAATFVPSNAVIAIVGNLGSIPLRAVLQSEFGSIPAGVPTRRARPAPLDSAIRVTHVPRVARPLGVIGLIAPALDDTMHAAFYMELALVGGHVTRLWGTPERPLTSRFHYSLYDDPDLARFYPPVGPAEHDPALVDGTFHNALNDLSGKLVTPPSYIALHRGLDWLLGGPMPPEIFDRVLEQPGALHALATGTAVRELWGGEAFWSTYRDRFRTAVGTPYKEWYKRMFAPQFIVNLLVLPPK